VRIIDVRSSENCLDGTQVKELFLDSQIDETFVSYLGILGPMNYYKSFQRPFFRLNTSTGLIVKGVIGENKLTVLITGPDSKEQLDLFSSSLQFFMNDFN
jgi:hypothetical protein